MWPPHQCHAVQRNLLKTKYTDIIDIYLLAADGKELINMQRRWVDLFIDVEQFLLFSYLVPAVHATKN